MRRFAQGELWEAVAHAMQGGQSLHLHRVITPTAPACFREAVARGEDIAHLLDQDPLRLVRTARRLGVKVIKVERQGTNKQHVDLCGAPLRKALRECEKP